ncbi:SPFH domain-containing protein [Adlercreutzia sp. ZJ141]|uniref:SPFH domain-containing protein n=1 Tax=Adlercreutzia sp. ZJ141 TaxID=2709406 RepID=UPI0013EC3ACF|nr:SPFH domain-containing protein [Adlercreutzia sp. ZJ141]
MGVLRAVSDAVGGSLADQWRDIYTASPFDEHTVVTPGILKNRNNGRGTNRNGSDGVISNGSRIFVPENTAAFVFSQAGIETVVTEPGGYVYMDGEESLFSSPNVVSLINQVADRVGYGGISVSEKRVAFVNLREIRHIPFGTRGAQVYNDLYYQCDLEVYSYGTFSVRVVDPVLFLKNFVPANVFRYSFDFPSARKQVLAEFLQSFIVALNSLSGAYRISQLPAQAKEISNRVASDSDNAGSWPIRFGFEVVKVAIENIEFSPESKELVRQFSSNRMNVKAYEDASQRASSIAAQQKISQGVQDFGLGDGGGMLLGMNLASGVSAQGEMPFRHAMSLDEQVEALKKIKGLVDAGILTKEEFDTKKKEILGF